MKKVTLLPLIIVTFGLCIIGACGGGGASTNQPPVNPGPSGNYPPDLQQALGEVETLSPPADVDAALFTDLKDELNRQLAALNGSKFTAAVKLRPPAQEAGRVPIIAPVLSTREVIRIAWRDRNPGDYNNDGKVGADDLVPLARRFGQALNDGDEDGFDLEIDGDGSGGIDLGDVKPVAENYYNQVTGYNVYRSVEGQEATPELIGAVAAATAHLLPRGGSGPCQ